MCCKVIRIVELEKPAGVWCRHASPGHGCTIYADRPTPCQVFRCVWLDQPETPEALKPDRTKVVLASNDTKLIAHCDPADPTAWRREPMYSFLKRQAWPGAGPPRPVLVVAGRRIWLITAAADHDLGEVDGAQSFHVEPGLDGKPIVRLTGHEAEARWEAGPPLR
ncbi:MAG TPA: YkgJ family cysteine cluster protein [Phenylobacterium sp.]